MYKFIWYNGLVDVELEAGSLSQEFVDGLDIAAIINRCFGAKEGGDTMDFTDKQIDFMRQDLESDMSLTKMIEAAKKRFIAEGRDFDKEFAEYRKGSAQRCVISAQQRVIDALRKHEQNKGY